MSDPPPAPRPHATFACIAISILISIPWLLYDRGRGVEDLHHVLALAPTPSQIFAEHLYWGLITATFIHLGWVHLIFNMLMMYRLSPTMEMEIGSFRWLGFFAAAALVTSGFQLTIGGGGLGMSGVLYAIFGFMWQARRRYQIFGDVVSPELVKLLLGWLVLCYILTWLKVLLIANTAHLSGLIFGYAAAWTLAPKRLLRKKIIAGVIVGAMLCLSTLSIAVDLRLVTITYRLAERAARRGDTAAAEFWRDNYERLGGDYRRDVPAIVRRLIKAGDYAEAAQWINAVGTLDPNLAAELRAELEAAEQSEPAKTGGPETSGY